jgi:hypothetical protein
MVMSTAWKKAAHPAALGISSRKAFFIPDVVQFEGCEFCTE